MYQWMWRRPRLSMTLFCSGHNKQVVWQNMPQHCCPPLRREPMLNERSAWLEFSIPSFVLPLGLNCGGAKWHCTATVMWSVASKIFLPPYIDVYLYFLIQYLCNPMVKCNIWQLVCIAVFLGLVGFIKLKKKFMVCLHGLVSTKSRTLGLVVVLQLKNKNSWHAGTDYWV